MPTMCCLAIGISDAPPLDYLPGAANGARAIGSWAQAAGYRTHILTDEAKPVEIADVEAAIEALLPRNDNVDRLLLYFAGHGLSRGAAEDLWLLSRWHEEQRAIAVGGLRRKLERFSIGQITIVADACRSAAADAESGDLTADHVLGRGPYPPNLPTIDLLRAAPSFRAAYMVPGDRPEDDRCIFSGVLVEALSGAHPEAFAKDEVPPKITSYSLADFLSAAVPKRAAEYRVVLQPDIVTGYRPPNHVYLAAMPDPAPAPGIWPAAATLSAMGVTDPSRGTGMRGWSTQELLELVEMEVRSGYDVHNLWKSMPPPSMPEGGADPAERDSGDSHDLWASAEPPSFAGAGFDALVDADRAYAEDADQWRAVRTADLIAGYADEGERPTHFETRAGFVLLGATARRVSLGRHAIAQDDRDASWWRIAPSANGDRWQGGQLVAPLPLLVELDDGRWAGAAILPGHITAFTAAEAGVVSMVWRAIDDSDQAREGEAAVARLRAGALANPAAVTLIGDTVPHDPVSAVLAAYLQDARGDVAAVRRIAVAIAMRGDAIPFDIAMLGRLPITDNGDGMRVAEIPATDEQPTWSAPIAGCFPWLRQGWAILDDSDPDSPLTGALPMLRAALQPAHFTTFSADGGARLFDIIERI